MLSNEATPSVLHAAAGVDGVHHHAPHMVHCFLEAAAAVLRHIFPLSQLLLVHTYLAAVDSPVGRGGSGEMHYFLCIKFTSSLDVSP